jgi:hypothetical protein
MSNLFKMKSSIFSLFLVSGLFLASCAKEKIAPSNAECVHVPVLKTSSSPLPSSNNPVEDGFTITDPNSDPDGSVRNRKKKN